MLLETEQRCATKRSHYKSAKGIGTAAVKINPRESHCSQNAAPLRNGLLFSAYQKPPRNSAGPEEKGRKSMAAPTAGAVSVEVCPRESVCRRFRFERIHR